MLQKINAIIKITQPFCLSKWCMLQSTEQKPRAIHEMMGQISCQQPNQTSML